MSAPRAFDPSVPAPRWDAQCERVRAFLELRGAAATQRQVADALQIPVRTLQNPFFAERLRLVHGVERVRGGANGSPPATFRLCEDA